jgi:transposase-like protein
MTNTTAAISPLTALSAPQAEVALAIASGASITEAAKKAGVHRSTVYEWMRSEPAFSAAVEEARREYIDLLRHQLRSMSAKALSRIEALLDDPTTPASVALRAALAVLGRPRIPDQGWLLPEPVNTPEEENYARDLALVEADYKALCRRERMARAQSPAVPSDTIRQNQTEIPFPRPAPADGPPRTPRNAACPCGSGKKYKRCCDSSAPPVLSSAA